MSHQWGVSGAHEFVAGMRALNPTPAGWIRYWEIGERRMLMQQLESFLAAVLETDQLAFDIRQQWGRERAVRIPKGDSDFRSLSGFASQCGHWMDLYWPGYAYSADLQLFFDCFIQHPFSQVFGYGAPAGCDMALAAHRYNDFIGYLRSESVRTGVKKWLSDWRGNLWDQAESISHYLSELAKQYKNMVLIRADLNYAEYAIDASDAMPRMEWVVSDGGVWMPVPSNAAIGHGRPETRARIDTAVAMGHRDSFFSNRRGADKNLFERMVGHVCKLEHGGRHGANHFHCVFLIDGRRLTESDLFAIKFGLQERWRRVTGGQGLMFDCHERPDRAEIKARGQWAIDPVNCSDAVQVARFIDYIVGYFTKDDDQMVRVKPTSKAQTLTKGRLSVC